MRDKLSLEKKEGGTILILAGKSIMVCNSLQSAMSTDDGVVLLYCETTTRASGERGGRTDQHPPSQRS